MGGVDGNEQQVPRKPKVSKDEMEFKQHAKQKKSIYRVLTCLFGGDLLVIALVTIIAAAVIIKHYKPYLDFAEPKYLGAVAFTLVVGVFVLLVSAVCFYAVVKQTSGILQSFIILVVVLLFLHIIAGSICLAYRREVDKAVHRTLNDGIRKYHRVTKDKEFFDWLHKEYKCCGLDGPSNFMPRNSSHVTQKPPTTAQNLTTTKSNVTVATTKSNATLAPTTKQVNQTVQATTKSQELLFDTMAGLTSGVPQSCCKENSTSPTCAKQKNNIFTKGCRKDFESLVHYLLGVVGTIAFACAIIELIGACIAYVYLVGVKEESYLSI